MTQDLIGKLAKGIAYDAAFAIEEFVAMEEFVAEWPKVDAVFKQYAKALGRDLTDAEKKQLIIDRTIAKLDNRLMQAGEAGLLGGACWTGEEGEQ